MPAGKHRSRSMRRVFVKTPGGVTKLHYRQRKPSKAKCAGCGKILQGTPHKKTSKQKNLPKTKKRPSRPYGGVLCSACMRKQMREKNV